MVGETIRGDSLYFSGLSIFLRNLRDANGMRVTEVDGLCMFMENCEVPSGQAVFGNRRLRRCYGKYPDHTDGMMEDQTGG